MKANKIYGICLLVILLGNLASCKKSTSGNAPAVVPNGTITYDASSDIFPNPERGFIRTYPVYAEGASLDQSQLNLQRGLNVSMVLRVFYLDKFKASAISDAELLLVQTDLDKIKIAGLKAILRFAYTDDPTAQDAPMAIVQQHLDQLKPVFEKNKDIIAFVQAGFIGTWGEWHGSTNNLSTVENERLVLNKILSVVPQGIMVQVRTPQMKQQVFNSILPVGKDIAYTSEGRARVGHHNDCFLSGVDDYGTYTNVDIDKQYINMDALYVPTGGETCPPEAGFSPDCTAGAKEMQLLRWTYLNLDWYQPTINAWKLSGCFDEFQRHLGYRLALVDAMLSEKAVANADYKVHINIINNGYAPIYNQKIAYLILKNKSTGEYHEWPLAIDLRDCKPAATLTIDEAVKLTGIGAGNYGLYLRIADGAPSLKTQSVYAVRLANAGVWDETNGGMNDLKAQLTITGQ